MTRLILLCLILFITNHLHAQTNTKSENIPPQVMQLGRGTADTLDWHPSANVLAVGGQRGVWLYDEALADLAHFEEVSDVIRISWSPNGSMLSILTSDSTLQVWLVNLEPYSLTLHQSWTFDRTQDSFLYWFSWSPDSEKLAVITANGTQILDVITGEMTLNIPDLDYSVTWHPDGTQIAGVVDLGEDNGKHVRVWDTLTGDIINTYNGVDQYLYWYDIQWSPDGSILIGLTSLPATLHVWSAETGGLLNEVDTHKGEFGSYFDMWWVNDGQQFITLSRSVTDSASTTLELWDVTNWTRLEEGFWLGDAWRVEKRPNTEIWGLLTSAGQLMIWSLELGETLATRSDHGQSPQILTWSPDNQYLAAARSFGETLYIWDMITPSETPLQTLTSPYHWLDVEALYWNFDSSILRGVLKHSQFTAPGTQVTGFVVEWDAQTGESLGAIHETGGHIAHDGSGSYLPLSIWSADFTRVATVLEDEPITISEVERDQNGRLTLGDVISTVDVENDSAEIIWSPDNTMLVVISRDTQGETSAWVYDADTGNLINRLRPTFPTTLYDISWNPDSSMVALVGSCGIAGSGETEYRLDVEAIDMSSTEARHVTTILDTGTRFYHTWHPESHTIAVSTSSGVEIFPIESAPIGINATSVAIIPDMSVYALAWSPNGVWLAGSHKDGTIRVWNVTADR